MKESLDLKVIQTGLSYTDTENIPRFGAGRIYNLTSVEALIMHLFSRSNDPDRKITVHRRKGEFLNPKQLLGLAPCRNIDKEIIGYKITDNDHSIARIIGTWSFEDEVYASAEIVFHKDMAVVTFKYTDPYVFRDVLPLFALRNTKVQYARFEKGVLMQPASLALPAGFKKALEAHLTAEPDEGTSYFKTWESSDIRQMEPEIIVANGRNALLSTRRCGCIPYSMSEEARTLVVRSGKAIYHIGI